MTICMQRPVTICLTYFRSLALANLEAALFSVRWQDLRRVDSLVVVDNDTADSQRDIENVIEAMDFPFPVQLFSMKHGIPERTHAWSTNFAVDKVRTPWVFFTRADYLLDFTIVHKLTAVAEAQSEDAEVFIASHGFHLAADIGVCEQAGWRAQGLAALLELPGAEINYTPIDAGVWMTRRRTFKGVQGLDEGLTAWGHAQTLFQYRLHAGGACFIRVPEVLFYHPQHAAPRDLDLAHRQLRERGINIQDLWRRHEGASPY